MEPRRALQILKKVNARHRLVQPVTRPRTMMVRGSNRPLSAIYFLPNRDFSGCGGGSPKSFLIVFSTIRWLAGSIQIGLCCPSIDFIVRQVDAANQRQQRSHCQAGALVGRRCVLRLADPVEQAPSPAHRECVDRLDRQIQHGSAPHQRRNRPLGHCGPDQDCTTPGRDAG